MKVQVGPRADGFVIRRSGVSLAARLHADAGLSPETDICKEGDVP